MADRNPKSIERAMRTVGDKLARIEALAADMRGTHQERRKEMKLTSDPRLAGEAQLLAREVAELSYAVGVLAAMTEDEP